MSNPLWENNINTPQDGRKIFCQLFIFIDLEPFFCYFMIAKTLNMSHMKYILVYIYQYSPIETSKDLLYKNICNPQNGINLLWQFFIFVELEPFFYYFVITKTLNMSHVKFILAYLNQYSPMKICIKRSMGQQYTYFTRW